jgi:hypothetical protein
MKAGFMMQLQDLQEALNDKELELMELRVQHNQLQARARQSTLSCSAVHNRTASLES